MAIVDFVNNQSPYLNATNLNKIQEANIYSSNEIEIGRWIDNKPVYRKVIQQNLDLSSAGVHNFDVGLSDVDSVVDIKYNLIAGIRKLTYNNAISAIGIDTSDNLYIYTGTAWDNNIAFTFVIEYTKTTDE